MGLVMGKAPARFITYCIKRLLPAWLCIKIQLQPELKMPANWHMIETQISHCIFDYVHTEPVFLANTGDKLTYMRVDIWNGTLGLVDIVTSHWACCIDWLQFSFAVHDGVTKWKQFPRYWTFVRGIHRSPVNSPHNGQWRIALMFSLICTGTNGWVNNRHAGDLRRQRTHYGVTVIGHWSVTSIYLELDISWFSLFTDIIWKQYDIASNGSIIQTNTLYIPYRLSIHQIFNWKLGFGNIKMSIYWLGKPGDF